MDIRNNINKSIDEIIKINQKLSNLFSYINVSNSRLVFKQIPITLQKNTPNDNELATIEYVNSMSGGFDHTKTLYLTNTTLSLETDGLISSPSIFISDKIQLNDYNINIVSESGTDYINISDQNNDLGNIKCNILKYNKLDPAPTITDINLEDTELVCKNISIKQTDQTSGTANYPFYITLNDDFTKSTLHIYSLNIGDLTHKGSFVFYSTDTYDPDKIVKTDFTDILNLFPDISTAITFINSIKYTEESQMSEAGSIIAKEIFTTSFSIDGSVELTTNSINFKKKPKYTGSDPISESDDLVTVNYLRTIPVAIPNELTLGNETYHGELNVQAGTAESGDIYIYSRDLSNLHLTYNSISSHDRENNFRDLSISANSITFSNSTNTLGLLSQNNILTYNNTPIINIDESNINIDNIHNINIVTGTITSPPDDDSDIVNKKYVDDNSIDKTKPLELQTGDSDTYSLKINKGIILNDKEIINSSGDVIINNNLTFKSNDDTNYNIHMDDTKTNLIIPDNTLIQIDSYDDLGNHAIANKAYVDSKVFDNTQTLTLTTESEPSIKADNNIETEKAIKSLDLITTNIKYDAGTTLATISTDTITFKSNVYIENKYLLLTNMSTFAIGPSISAPVFTIKYDSASSKINMNGNINMSGDKIAINNIEMSVDAATPTSLKFTYTDSSNKVYTGSITLTAQA